MERVHRSDLTVNDTVPVHPYPGPHPPAGPGETEARG